jgi:hypothetical protein
LKYEQVFRQKARLTGAHLGVNMRDI